MAITFPLSLPATPGFSRLTFKPFVVAGGSPSTFTKQQQSYLYPGEGWALSATLPPMKRLLVEPWICFLLALRGKSGSFLFGSSTWATPQGIATGTPLVRGAGQIGTVLLTDGWTASQTGILKAGDMIQLGTGTTQRIYKSLLDVNSDGSGIASIDLFPRLRESPADNAAVTISSCKGAFRLANNQPTWDIDTACIYGIGFEAEEAL
jgi:hypothetical protein